MRARGRSVLAGFVITVLGAGATACGSGPSAVSAAAKPEPVAITAVPVESRPIDRYLRVTGSLMADEEAEVGSEAAGRVVETPVERGTRVAEGALLVRISAAETSAQLREAEANAAQLQARLGLDAAESFDPKRVGRATSSR